MAGLFSRFLRGSKPKALKRNDIPQHLGVILDGNRRWAKRRKLPTFAGHRRGLARVESVVREAFNLGVQFVSLFVFSSENWKRSETEVQYLMKLFVRFCEQESPRLIAEGFRVRFAGRINRDLTPEVRASIKRAEKSSKNNTGPMVILCLNYGGRLELVDAVKQMLKKKLKPTSVDEESLRSHLYHPDVPDLDLVIRTSGDKRISGFQLWRSTYAEFLFIKKCWPSFSPRDLRRAVAIYQKRHRRFGGD